MRVPIQKRERNGGFTLIEVMITLLVMSMILVTLTANLTGARRTRDIIYNAQESQRAGPAILDMIESDLRGLFVFDRKVLDILHVDDRSISGMDADRLDFVTTNNSRTITPNDLRTRFLRADITEVGYCLRPNPDYPGEFLEIYRREGFGIDGEPFKEGTYTFLNDRIRRFDIQVFFEDGIDSEPLDSWGLDTGDSEHRGIPTRLEIELEIELSTRLINEYSTTKSAAMKKRVLYRRIIHFPAALHLAMDLRPVFRVPMITPPSNVAGGGGSSSSQPDKSSTGSSTSIGAPDGGQGGTVSPFGGGGGGGSTGGGAPPPIFGGG